LDIVPAFRRTYLGFPLGVLPVKFAREIYGGIDLPCFKDIICGRKMKIIDGEY